MPLSAQEREDQEEDRRWKAEHRRLQAKVRVEISRAAGQGLAWTTPRPFHSNMEYVGAGFCCSCRGRGLSRARARKSHYVSYSTHIAGRVTACLWCHEGLGEFRDAMTSSMRKHLLQAFDANGEVVTSVPGSTKAAFRRYRLLNADGLTQLGHTARKMLSESPEAA